MKIRIIVFLASLLCTVGSHAHVIVRFSPEGSAQKLVMNTLNIARNSINGIEARTVDNYKIMHDKVAIIDDVTVQIGSFNTRAAQRSNSENVVVMRNMPRGNAILSGTLAKPLVTGESLAVRLLIQ